MVIKVITVILVICVVEVLTKKGRREPSGVMEMLSFLLLGGCYKGVTYVKLQGAVYLRYVHFPVCVLHLNTNK